MTRSLKGKLILSYLAVALVTVLVVSAVIRMTSGQSLMSLVVEQQTAALMDTVQTYYTANGSMDGFFDYYLQAGRTQPAAYQPGGGGKPGEPRDIRGLYGLVDSQYCALIPTFGYQVGQTVPAEMIQKPIAVEVEGETVAWILPDTKMQFSLSPEEEGFLRRTSLAIGLAAGAGVLLAVTMGVFLAGRLLEPIRRLTGASRALAQGNLEQQVPVTSQDELGQLTETFNQMSADLARLDQQRKRMTADITHDLGTPLQVISGYMEMIEEGEVTLTPQRIEVIKTEIDHLRRLVGDLTTLSQVEAGGLDIQLSPVPPRDLMDKIYTAYQPIAARAGVELILNTAEAVPDILVDEGRMLQVLKNLMENALRYTPKGGRITLGVEGNSPVKLRISDSGVGIEAEDLPFVFDRFYQGEKARGVNSGKMGLGLAICKALIHAQGGTIAAESTGRGMGTTMVITFEPGPKDLSGAAL